MVFFQVITKTKILPILVKRISIAIKKCNYVQQVTISIPGMLKCVLHLLNTGMTIDCVWNKSFDASLLSKNCRIIQIHFLNKCIVLIVEGRWKMLVVSERIELINLILRRYKILKFILWIISFYKLNVIIVILKNLAGLIYNCISQNLSTL